MSRIFIIDDDLAMDVLGESLRYRGHEVERIASAQKALDRLAELASADMILIDIIMPWPEGRPAAQLANASTSGMEVLLEIRKQNTKVPIIVYSATQDAAVVKAVEETPGCSFISKWEGCSLQDFVSRINRVLGVADESFAAKPFIVHGHDEAAKLALKNYLQNTLKFPEPIILHEQPSLGRSIIEKFEDYAELPGLVFVLLTPDDPSATGNEPDDTKRRARQNVIFEMGYFLGALGRRSGRVILLHRGPIDLPSDISGVIYVDISAGVEAAGETIRREVAHAAG